MTQVRHFYRTAGKLRQFTDADEVLRHAASHVKHDRDALREIAKAMLRLPVLRPVEQFNALQRMAQ